MADWSLLHARIHQRLRRTGWLPPHTPVLVGVSGGQDSLCLLKLLVDLQPQWHWSLQGVHCDHRWRSDSPANAAFVQELCRQWQVPCQVVRADRPPASEAAARQWRYRVFADLAAPEARVVTGHTATDRAETLLYNLLRGSGADGLQALVWERRLSPQRPDVRLVRPLLAIARGDTQAFCQTWQIPVWEDSTNCDRTYRRNRIRLELMPYLARTFNPRVEAALAQTADILTAEVDYLEQAAAELYATTVEESPLRIQRRRLSRAHVAMQRRVLRRALQTTISGEITFAHIEKLTVLLTAPNRSQSDPFPGGTIARVENDWIVLEEGPHDPRQRSRHPEG